MKEFINPIKISNRLLSLMPLCLFSMQISDKGNETTKGIDCKKCDTSILTVINENSKHYSYQQVCDFFCTVDKSCVDNVEFSEMSNSLLFKILLIEPQLSLKSLSKEQDTSLDFILRELSEPIDDTIDLKKIIDDTIDLKKIYSKVSEVKGYDKVKEKVLLSLQEAISKK